MAKRYKEKNPEKYGENDTARTWIFRINECSGALLEEQHQWFASLPDKLDFKYCLITLHNFTGSQKPKEQSTSQVPHWHGVIIFQNVRGRYSVKRQLGLERWILPNHFDADYYFEPRYKMSTNEQALAYIEKYTILYEFGTRPQNLAATASDDPTTLMRLNSDEKLKKAIEFVKAGKLEEYEQWDTCHFFRNIDKLLARYGCQETFTQDRRQFTNYWIYGSSGTGKSSICNALWPDAYVVSNGKYWGGFNPRFPGHKVSIIKDVNSKWMLDYGIQQLKQIADPDGHAADIKYRQGIVINHQRILITSNFPIYMCLKGTAKDDIVGYDVELQALKNRFHEIHIDDFLRLCGHELKTKPELVALRGKQFDPSVLFNKFGPNNIPGFGQEQDDPELHRIAIDLSADTDEESIDLFQ
jgi:hypothetical protein